MEIFNQQTYQRLKRHQTALTFFGFTFWILATIILVSTFTPHILYTLNPNTPTVLAKNISTTKININQYIPSKPLPLQDDKLPSDYILLIPKIGVAAKIQSGDNPEELLKNGVLATTGYDLPTNNRPLILASHRWGYLNWTSNFRKLNSFYSLPKLETGDQITIIHEQRQYEYRITRKITSTQYEDLKSDLILYTCELWNSPNRIFIHAERIN